MSYYPKDALLVSVGGYQEKKPEAGAQPKFAARDDVHPYVTLDGAPELKGSLVSILESMGYTRNDQALVPGTYNPNNTYGVQVNLRKGQVSQFANDLLGYLGDIRLIDRDLPLVQQALAEPRPVDSNTETFSVAEIAARTTKAIQGLSRRLATSQIGG